jgi:hypothetical protein
VFILKGFKSCVLEVRILKKLRAHFSEVRILKSLEKKALVGERHGSEDSPLQKLEKELNAERLKEERSWEGKGDWVGCDVTMG